MNSVTPTHRREDACIDETDGSPPKGPHPAVSDQDKRVLAQAKYDALASGDLGHAACTTNDIDESCGTEPIPNAVLLAPKKVNGPTIDGSDVTQFRLNDCHLMAPLAALASSPAGRELIKNAITEHKNDSGTVVSYTVKLYQSEKHFWGPTTFSEVKIDVTGEYGENHAKPARTTEGWNVVWPPVMEKAFAKLSGGYGQIDGGGSPARAMEALTGRPAVDIPLGRAPGYSADQLRRDLDAGKIVVLLSKQSFSGEPPRDIDTNHGYQISKADPDGDRTMVQLHNPWNQPGHDPAPIAFSELTKWFAAVDIGRVK